jgi:hypothetical protein
VTSAPSLWVLLVADQVTGAATRPVGVLGVAGDDHHVSWLPLEPRADVWQDRLVAPSEVPIAERVAFWAQQANGRSIDLAPLDPPPGGAGLHDAVEAAIDELLASGAGE